MNEFEPAQSREEAILQNMLGAANELEPPESRVEKILQNMLGANHALEPPQSRIEKLLMRILDEGGPSGGGATSMTDVKFDNGTLAQPLSEANYTTLVQQIIENKACAEISFNFRQTAVSGYLQCNPDQHILYANGANVSNSLSESIAYTLIWSNVGAATRAKAIMSGGVVDLLSMVSQIACTVTIHTLDTSVYQ